MLRSWLEPQTISLPGEYLEAVGGNPLVSQVLYKRGMVDINSVRGFLSPEYYHPTPPSELPGLEKACDMLQYALAGKKRVGVWGDFDVDGQTATTVLVSGLSELGGDVIYHIPVRASESHGIGLQPLVGFLDQGVQLLLTCDTGISSHEAVDYARSRGIPVIITDHHDLLDDLPSAEAIINPKMLPAEHPLSSLPGVGVAYKLIEQLFTHHGNQPRSDQYLDLVALGIVADIALLKGDTRYLLQRGLQVLRNTSRMGLLAMMDFAELLPANITEEHIAYVLGPRMNALGRLDDANLMVELLTTSDPARARILALELEGMNAQRKLLSDQVYQAALGMLEKDPSLLEDAVLVLSHPSWPAGVVGVVASRLVELYHRPVILLSAPPGEDARGSARSIEGVNITSAISASSNLVKSYGGHPMAAGLAIDPLLIPEFRHTISQAVQSLGISLQREKDLQVDAYLTLPELTLNLVEDLERLAPYGAGNPSLVLASRNLKLIGYAVVGRADEHLQLTLEDDLGYTQRSVWWQGAGYPLPEAAFDLAYSVRASTYRGQKDVQIEWIDYRLPEVSGITPRNEKPALEVLDYRKEANPLVILGRLQHTIHPLIWGEANPTPGLSCSDRNSLIPSETMAIWTIPPGSEVLRQALNTVHPTQLYLFAVDPLMDEPQAFLERLLGLLKFSIKSFQGNTRLSDLAAATAQKMTAVRLGLDWLVERGHVTILSADGDDIRVGTAVKQSPLTASSTLAQLNSALAESAAFRRYYLKADKNHLVTSD